MSLFSNLALNCLSRTKTMAECEGISMGEEQQVDKLMIWKAIRRLSLIFVLVGIYARDDRRAKCLDIAAIVYCGLVMCISSASFLLYLPYIYFSSSCTSYFVHVLGNALVTLCVVATSGVWIYINLNITKLCISLEDIYIKMKASFPPNLNHKVTVVKVFLIILLISNLGRMIPMVQSTWSKISDPHTHFTKSDWYYVQLVPLQGLYFVHMCLDAFTYFLFIGAMSIVYVFFAFWCYLSYSCFVAYEAKLSELLKDNIGSSASLEKMRLYFEDCLSFMIESNSIFMVFLGFTFLCHMSILCLYIFLSASENAEVRTTGFYLFNIIPALAFTTIPAIISNGKVSNQYFPTCQLNFNILIFSPQITQ